MTKNAETENLRQALVEVIRDLHNCEATWEKSVPVCETFDGVLVWNGDVEIFGLSDHSTAKRCYAWSHPIDGSTKYKYYAVLHAGPVDSPQAAVRAAILAEHHK